MDQDQAQDQDKDLDKPEVTELEDKDLEDASGGSVPTNNNCGC